MSESPSVYISIVVACRNEGRYIRELLNCIASQDLEPGSWEALIADGRSTDETRYVIEEVARTDQRFRIIDNEKQIVPTGLNKAIREARGDIIIRMDAHTVYASDYCRRCVEVLNATGAQNVGGPARTHADSGVARAVAAAYHSRFSTGGARFHNVEYEGWVDTVPYGCWRKSTLEGLGLFDETLVRNQDDELNLRILRAGGKIWQTPAVVSWYSPRPNLSQLFRQYFQYGFWKVAVIRKHRIPSSWRHLVPVLFVITNCAGIGATVLSELPELSQWFAGVSRLWLSMVGIYLAASLSASCVAAKRGGWTMLPYLPAIFAIYHLSYGLGFSAGLLRLVADRKPATPLIRESVFTRLSR